MLAAEALVCVVLVFAKVSAAGVFSSAAAFPFEQLGAELRSLSLSSRLGNAAAITAGGKEKKDSTSVTLTISYMFRPDNIVILQMDADSAVISRTEYAPDAAPDSISAEPEAVYLIAETYKTDGGKQIRVSRDIYGKEDQSLETFSAGEYGVCIKKSTKIVW